MNNNNQNNCSSASVELEEMPSSASVLSNSCALNNSTTTHSPTTSTGSNSSSSSSSASLSFSSSISSPPINGNRKMFLKRKQQQTTAMRNGSGVVVVAESNNHNNNKKRILAKNTDSNNRLITIRTKSYFESENKNNHGDDDDDDDNKLFIRIENDHFQRFYSNLRKKLIADRQTDTLIIMDGSDRFIQAHRVILEAGSPYFERKLNGIDDQHSKDFKAKGFKYAIKLDNGCGCVAADYAVVKCCIDFIYSGCTELKIDIDDQKYLNHLKSVAELLELESLVKICTHYLAVIDKHSSDNRLSKPEQQQQHQQQQLQSLSNANNFSGGNTTLALWQHLANQFNPFILANIHNLKSSIDSLLNANNQIIYDSNNSNNSIIKEMAQQSPPPPTVQTSEDEITTGPTPVPIKSTSTAADFYSLFSDMNTANKLRENLNNYFRNFKLSSLSAASSASLSSSPSSSLSPPPPPSTLNNLIRIETMSKEFMIKDKYIYYSSSSSSSSSMNDSNNNDGNCRSNDDQTDQQNFLNHLDERLSHYSYLNGLILTTNTSSPPPPRPHQHLQQQQQHQWNEFCRQTLLVFSLNILDSSFKFSNFVIKCNLDFANFNSLNEIIKQSLEECLKNILNKLRVNEAEFTVNNHLASDNKNSNKNNSKNTTNSPSLSTLLRRQQQQQQFSLRATLNSIFYLKKPSNCKSIKLEPIKSSTDCFRAIVEYSRPNAVNCLPCVLLTANATVNIEPVNI